MRNGVEPWAATGKHAGVKNQSVLYMYLAICLPTPCLASHSHRCASLRLADFYVSDLLCDPR